MTHRPELDGLRGVAILIVLAAHTGLGGFAAEGGFAGVTLFFVLSGFLITSLICREHEATGRLDLVAFYIRRGLRLFPALLAVLLVVVVGYGLHLWISPPAPSLDSLPITVVVVLAYVANWASIGFHLGVLGHTWSLGIEEQFYLIWPLALIAGLHYLGARRMVLVVVAVAAIVPVWRLVLIQGGDASHVFNGTDTHADALLLGCAIALARVRTSTVVGWVGLAALIGLGAIWVSGSTGLVVFMSLATIASAAALAGCPPILAWRPLAYVGRISYGIYLWHYLLIWWDWPAPVAIAFSVGVAIVSYEYLERPFLQLKDRFRRARPSDQSFAGTGAVAEVGATGQ